MLEKMTLINIIAVLSIGAGAGFINILAGGGSFLTLPLLIFLGLPPNLANGTNRLAILMQNIFAVSTMNTYTSILSDKTDYIVFWYRHAAVSDTC